MEYKVGPKTYETYEAIVIRKTGRYFEALKHGVIINSFQVIGEPKKLERVNGLKEMIKRLRPNRDPIFVCPKLYRFTKKQKTEWEKKYNITLQSQKL